MTLKVITLGNSFSTLPLALYMLLPDPESNGTVPWCPTYIMNKVSVLQISLFVFCTIINKQSKENLKSLKQTAFCKTFWAQKFKSSGMPKKSDQPRIFKLTNVSKGFKLKSLLKYRSKALLEAIESENTEVLTKLPGLIPAFGGNPQRTLIVASWRSGSTFLSQLLAANLKDMRYAIYEPLLAKFRVQLIRNETAKSEGRL